MKPVYQARKGQPPLGMCDGAASHSEGCIVDIIDTYHVSEVVQ